MTKSFNYKQNHLHCEDIDLQDFSSRTETPFYIYSKQEIINNCSQIKQAGEGVDLLACYAFKANFNPVLLSIIRDMGIGADVVSGNELRLALHLGFDPQKIVFAGVGKTAQEIELAVNNGIHSLNVESFEEYEQIEKICGQLKKEIRIAVRINPDIEARTHAYISTGKHINKFGVSPKEALLIYRRAVKSEWIKPEGIHLHLGSQITSAQPYQEAVEFIREFYKQVKNEGADLTFIDLGGGIGINYEYNFSNMDDPITYIQSLLPAYLQGFKDLNVKLVIELGRSIIASSALLVSKVLYRKETPQKKFFIVDAAMNNLIRPSLYKAYHTIVPLKNDIQTCAVVDVVGPVCESGDFLAKDRELPEMEQGDFLAVGGAGAYAQALASNYNLRPIIAEYLVDGRQVDTIFKAETFEDFVHKFGL